MHEVRASLVIDHHNVVGAARAIAIAASGMYVNPHLCTVAYMHCTLHQRPLHCLLSLLVCTVTLLPRTSELSIVLGM